MKKARLRDLIARLAFNKSADDAASGVSKQDAAWDDLLAEFDKWEQAYHSEQCVGRMAGHWYKRRSRAELLTSFLTTVKGRELYGEYQHTLDTRC